MIETVFTAINDGRIRLQYGEWAAIHDATTGGTIWTADATGFPAIYTRNSIGVYGITRSFLDFDLSIIPASATIVACTLSIHGHITANCNGSVQKGTQSDSLILADYNNFEGNPFNTITFTTDLMTFTLDAAGLSYIESMFGTTAKLCLREYNHDVLDSAPGLDETYQAGMHYSETAIEANRPILTVQYKS